MDDVPLLRSPWAVVGLVLLGGLVLVAFVGTVEPPGGSGPPSSSFSTGGDGVKAYAELLERAGYDVNRVRVPVSESPVPVSGTIVLFDGFVGSEDATALRGFVMGGGRLVVGGRSSVLSVFPQMPTVDTTATGPVRVVFPGFADVAEVATPSEFSAYGSAAGFVPVLGAGDAVLAGIMSDGEGVVVGLADTQMVSNEFLAQADNAAMALGLVGPAERPVSFLEYPHGFTRAEGLWALPLRWRWAFAGLGFAGVLWLLSRARRLGAPDARRRRLPPPRIEYVNGLAAGLARTKDLAGAAAPIQDRIRSELAARTNAERQLDTASLGALGKLVGLSPLDVERALAPPRDPSDVVVAGRVLAQLSRHRMKGRTR